MTEAHFAAFQMLSGDNHPIHYDIEFCKAHGLRGLLAHGFQVLAFSAVGAGTFPHMIGDKLIGFIEQSCKFLKGVYPGDTLYPAHTITALVPQRTTCVVVIGAACSTGPGMSCSGPLASSSASVPLWGATAPARSATRDLISGQEVCGRYGVPAVAW